MDKIFEKASSFHVKYGTPGKFWFLFFRPLLLVSAECFFWGGWALGFNSMIF